MNKMIKTLVGLLTVASSVLAYDVRLVWDPSPGPEISGYKLYQAACTNLNQAYSGTKTWTLVASVNTNQTWLVDGTNIPTALVTGLQTQTYYVFRVSATNSVAESDFSNELVLGRPMPPSNVKLVK